MLEQHVQQQPLRLAPRRAGPRLASARLAVARLPLHLEQQVGLAGLQFFVHVTAILQGQRRPVQPGTQPLRQIRAQQAGRFGLIGEHLAEQVVVRLIQLARHAVCPPP